MIKADEIDWEAFSFNGRGKGGFDARKFREWQLFRETTNGIAGLWMCHFIDLVPWFLQDPYPKSAVTQGGVYYWKDGRQTSDVFHSLIEYNDCLVSFEMSLTNASGNRNVWYGTLGTLDGDKLIMTPEGSRDPNRLTEAKPVERVQTDSHMANFLKCVRSRQQPRADVQAGFSHAIPVCMAAVALEQGRRVTFNREKLELA
jgi:predicted dehydrogenase